MVSRALCIFGLLLVSGTAAAHDASPSPRRAVAERSNTSSAWAAQLAGQASVRRSAARSEQRPAQSRDATGRAWSNVDLGSASGSGGRWTTQRFGNWSYSYSSDGTSCVSQRTAASVLIRCQ